MTTTTTQPLCRRAAFTRAPGTGSNAALAPESSPVRANFPPYENDDDPSP